MPRSRHRAWVLAGLLLAAGVGLAFTGRRPRLREGMRVLLVGDSLAVGLSPHLKGLAKDAGVDLKVLAKTGTRLDSWSSSPELRAVLDEWRPDAVLVSLGTNDAAIGTGAVDRQRPYLEQLLALFASVTHRDDYGLGAEVFWIGLPTPLPFEASAVVQMIHDQPGLQYFPSESLDIPRGHDNLHPTASGYAGWAGALWSWLT